MKLLLVAILLSLFLFPEAVGGADDQSSDGLPAVIFGTAFVSGQPAAPGTKIVARAGGKAIGSIETLEDGSFELSLTQPPGVDHAVTFTVGGHPVDWSYDWNSGDRVLVELNGIDSLSAPTNLIAMAGSESGAVDLRWNPPAGARYHFVAWIPEESQNLFEAGTLPVSAEGRASVTGLEVGKTYRFVVIAGRWDWSTDFGPKWSPWSGWVSATAAAPNPPPTHEPGEIGEPDTYIQIAVGASTACGLSAGGEVECWGSWFDREAPDLPTGFVSISTAFGHYCGVLEDGNARCWGGDLEGETQAPSGPFSAVSAGTAHSCGLRPNGEVVCWGSDAYGQASPLGGVFVQVEAGSSHSCGLRPNGTAECWGADASGLTSPPSGEFTSLTVGWSHSCGLRPDGSAECWGLERDDSGQIPNERFTSLSAGGFLATCGVTIHARLVCWGFEGPYTLPWSVRSVSVAFPQVCALTLENQVRCWVGQGPDDRVIPFGRTFPPDGALQAVTVGHEHTCGLLVDGNVECWSHRFAFGQPKIPDGNFTAVAAGSNFNCGLRTGGDVECWGATATSDVVPRSAEFQAPLSARFRSISVQYRSACGLRSDGGVECWHSSGPSGFPRPTGELMEVSGGAGVVSRQ